VFVCFDGSLEYVVLLFCPSGFSVVVVVELDWAKADAPSDRLNPMAIAIILDVNLMVSSVCRSLAAPHELFGDGVDHHPEQPRHQEVTCALKSWQNMARAGRHTTR
jgi:hypothetical protein